MPTKNSIFLSSKSLARRFRDRNGRFQKLDREKQKIKIIQDVVTYLGSMKLRAVKCEYLKVGTRKKIDQEAQLHDVIEESTTCNVCGIGGIFVAAIMLKNDFKVKDLGFESGPNVNLSTGDVNNVQMRSYLKRWFTLKQLELVEAAFEVTDGMSRKASNAEVAKAANFGTEYRYPKQRLLAICKNMLEHGGRFVPGK